MPITPFLSSKKGDVTGSIPRVHLLDAEDWRRAQAALATALDPQGNGSAVNWDNPDSGAKGSFVPVGKAYPLDGQVCRAFLAEIERKGQDRSLRGTACADRSGEWAVTEVNPWKKG